MVNPRLPTPLYQQVMALIQENIASGRWEVPRQIPSERELCLALGVSRTTVRQALAEAVRVGLLERVQGKGTFVARARVHQPLVGFTSFEETLRKLNLQPGLQVLDPGTPVTDLPAAAALGLAVEQSPVRFRLLGLGSGQPMVVYDSFLSPDLAHRVRPELERLPGRLTLIIDLVARVGGWSQLVADHMFEAAAADGETARLLGTRRGAPVLQVTAVFKHPHGQAVEYRRALYRSDRYQFQVTRRIEFHLSTR